MRKKRARQKRAKKRQADAQQRDCSSSAVKTSVDDSTTKNNSKPLQHILQNKEVLTQSHVLMTLKTEIGTCRILTNRVICLDEMIEAKTRKDNYARGASCPSHGLLRHGIFRAREFDSGHIRSC